MKTGKDLVRTHTGDRPLTKAQETFRALLGKVEYFRESIDAKETHGGIPSK